MSTPARCCHRQPRVTPTLATVPAPSRPAPRTGPGAAPCPGFAAPLAQRIDSRRVRADRTDRETCRIDSAAEVEPREIPRRAGAGCKMAPTSRAGRSRTRNVDRTRTSGMHGMIPIGRQPTSRPAPPELHLGGNDAPCSLGGRARVSEVFGAYAHPGRDPRGEAIRAVLDCLSLPSRPPPIAPPAPDEIDLDDWPT
jgi:hypothetical protein